MTELKWSIRKMSLKKVAAFLLIMCVCITTVGMNVKATDGGSMNVTEVGATPQDGQTPDAGKPKPPTPQPSKPTPQPSKPAVTHVSGVSLSKSSITIPVRKTATLTATVAPAAASNKNISWKSSDTKVATVSNKGVVTAKKAGKATITVTTADGNKKATCAVTVAEVKLNATSMPLQVGKSTSALKVSSKYPSNDKVKGWKSSNTKIAAVNSKGKVTGKKVGKAKVTVTMKSGATATCTVKVQKAKVVTKKLAISSKKLTLQKGKKATLTVTRNPVSATEKITWKSSNTKVATVTNKGVVKGKKAGKATITAKTSNGKKVTCKVTVKNPSVTLVKKSATIRVGKTTTIKVKSTFPKNDKVKSYKSSNKKVATVSNKGVVKGKKAGKATITVTMKSGAKTTFKVTVKK